MDRVDFVPRGGSSSHGDQSVPLLSEGLLSEGGKSNTIRPGLGSPAPYSPHPPAGVGVFRGQPAVDQGSRTRQSVPWSVPGGTDLGRRTSSKCTLPRARRHEPRSQSIFKVYLGPCPEARTKVAGNLQSVPWSGPGGTNQGSTNSS